MTLIILVVVAAITVALITAVAVAYFNGQPTAARHYPHGLSPNTIDIKPEYTRCTIRAERTQRPPKHWSDVRIAFFLANARQPVHQLNFDEWPREDMAAFEAYLTDLGFVRSASGTSDQLAVGMDRMQRMVIYSR